MNLSLGLPGTPIEVAYGIEAAAHTVEYGSACGSESLHQTVLALAQLGGVMSVGVDGAPFLPVLFVVGLDDFELGQLPATLPGGCQLQVSPEMVLLQFISSSRTATEVINVPAISTLLGSVVPKQ